MHLELLKREKTMNKKVILKLWLLSIVFLMATISVAFAEVAIHSSNFLVEKPDNEGFFRGEGFNIKITLTGTDWQTARNGNSWTPIYGDLGIGSGPAWDKGYVVGEDVLNWYFPLTRELGIAQDIKDETIGFQQNLARLILNLPIRILDVINPGTIAASKYADVIRWGIQSKVAKTIMDNSYRPNGILIKTQAPPFPANWYAFDADQTSGSSGSTPLFRVTNAAYSETANLDQAVKNEFGNDYSVADWTDITAHSGDIQNWANSIGMDHNDYYFVTWNGQGFSGNRHYFITRFDGTVDPGYLVHDQIGGNIITLGSWYGIQERILAIKTTNAMPSVVPAQSCSGIISGRIINAASRAPVPKAKIDISDSGDNVYSGTADSSGYFRSSPIFCRSKTYRVVCDTLGYTPAFQDVVTDENGNANADISISQEFEVNPETCAEMGGNWQSGECKFGNLL